MPRRQHGDVKGLVHLDDSMARHHPQPVALGAARGEELLLGDVVLDEERRDLLLEQGPEDLDHLLLVLRRPATARCARTFGRAQDEIGERFLGGGQALAEVGELGQECRAGAGVHGPAAT
jgi:hypothetical protein